MVVLSSSSLFETLHDHCIQCLESARLFGQQSWITVNQVCSNSICSVIWPRAWAQAAEDADISYLPVGMHPAEPTSETFQYASQDHATTQQQQQQRTLNRPMPYLSQPRDRALYAIDDDEDPSISPTLPSSSVPHYSYRPAVMTPAAPTHPSTHQSSSVDEGSTPSKDRSRRKGSRSSSSPKQSHSHDPVRCDSNAPASTPTPSDTIVSIADSSADLLASSPSPPTLDQNVTIRIEDRIDRRDIVDNDEEDGVLVASPTTHT